MNLTVLSITFHTGFLSSHDTIPQNGDLGPELTNCAPGY